MRAFILVAAIATATFHTIRAMPSPGVAARTAFNDDADFTSGSHPSHHHNKHHGRTVGDREHWMALDQAQEGSVPLGRPHEEKETPIARRGKVNKRGDVLRGRMIRNADYGSGNAPAGEAAAGAPDEAKPNPSPTATPAVSAKTSDEGPVQAAHA